MTEWGKVLCARSNARSSRGTRSILFASGLHKVLCFSIAVVQSPFATLPSFRLVFPPSPPTHVIP